MDKKSDRPKNGCDFVVVVTHSQECTIAKLTLINPYSTHQATINSGALTCIKHFDAPMVLSPIKVHAKLFKGA